MYAFKCYGLSSQINNGLFHFDSEERKQSKRTWYMSERKRKQMKEKEKKAIMLMFQLKEGRKKGMKKEWKG